MTGSRRGIFIVTVLSAIACGRSTESSATVVPPADTANAAPAGQSAAEFRVPLENEVSDTIVLASIRRGRALIHSTKDSLPGHVRASLSCSNCHMADGTQANAMPLVGSYARFPQYRARSGRIDLIEDRVNDCFLRSMNGTPLDHDGKDMHDIVAYLAFLSRGFPVGSEMKGQGVPQLPALKGDSVRGRALFATTCIACHGADGLGTQVAPPLWGPKSFNIGAGMARVGSAAKFIHQLMPKDRPGILTPQQAYDIAAYVTSQPRPDLPGKERDWPRGGAPSDVAYRVRAH
jgi:thiosulfate dehydrogenase